MVKCSRDGHKIFFDSWNQSTIEHKETVKILLLKRANKVLGVTTLSESGISGSLMEFV
jgi:DNA repair protein RadC